MPIRAQSADGVVHEFPDGTSMDVVDRAMATYAKEAPQDTGPKTQPTEGGFAPRDAREAEPTRAQKMGAYTEMAKGVRERQGPLAATADTIGRGLARAFPFMDDVAAGLDTITGLGKGENYQDNLDRQRAMNAADDSQRPVASYGAQIAGGLALPAGAVKTGASLGQQIARGAGVGAAYGSLYGAGQGDGLADRLDKAVSGGLVGGAVGGAAPPVLNALGYGAKAVGDLASNTARGIFKPEEEAARRVARAISIDAENNAARLTPELSQAAAENGQPIINADRGGETTLALSRSAANNSPEARRLLSEATGERFSNQSSRMSDWFANVFGDAAKFDVQQQLKDAAAKANKPAYDKAYAKGSGLNLWDDELASLAQAPDVQDAIRGVSRKAQNRAVVEGFDPIRNPFVVGSDGNLRLKMTAKADGTITPVSPNLQFWDNVARNLGDRIETLKRQGGNEAARDAIALKSQLTAKLDSMVPEFQQARQGASRFFGAEDALDAGSKFVSSTMSNAEAKAAIAKMTQPERELFKTGFVSALREKINGIRDQSNVVDQAFLGSNTARERIEMALGKADAAKLEAALRVERIMNETKRAVSGNSTTARQLGEMGLAGLTGGGLGAALNDDNHASGFTSGALAGTALKGGKAYVNTRIADNIGRMLSSNDPKVLSRLAQTAAASPAWMDALRSITRKLAVQQPGAIGVRSNITGGLHPAAAEDEKR